MNNWNAFESLPTTNEGWGELAQTVMSDIELGYVSGLQAKIYFTRIQKMLDTVKDVVDKAARDEADTYGEKEFTKDGAKVMLREAGVTFDYSTCNHPVYARLKEQVNPVLEEIKGLEKTLQTLHGKMIITDEATGETCEVYPPARKSKSIVAISL
jgi:hypothetical protein